MNTNKLTKWSLLALSLAAAGNIQAQERVVPLRYGDMNQWITRQIEESGIIGGHTKLLYEIGPTRSVEGNLPYSNEGGSPWGTSNVMAKVMGVVKTNTTVFPDKRDEGFCVRMETHIESVKVLGLLNISVLAAGSIYLGDMQEPITGTKNAEQNMNWGIPFQERPKALRYDYRVKLSGENDRIRLTGFSRKSKVEGKDCAITICLLQQRYEDVDGQITAKRVGTLVIRYDSSTSGWMNGCTYDILYGDITNHPDYDAETMGLRHVDYARNSKGENVLVKEIGWAESTAVPTHLMLQFSSSHGGAFVGSPGNTFWIDNVQLVY